MLKVAETQARAGNAQGAHRTARAVRDDFNRSFALRGIAEAQLERGDIASALFTADKMRPQDFARPIALGKIAAAQMRAGDGIAAGRTLERALQGAGEVRGLGLHCLWNIAEDLAEAGDVQGALRVAGGMPDTDWKGRALGDIARVQAKGGDVRGAFHTLSGIGDSSRKAMASAHVASALAERGDRAAAATACRQALRVAASMPDGPERDATLVSIVPFLIEVGETRGALRTAAAVRRPYERAFAFRVIGALLYRAGKRATASAALRRGLKVVAGMGRGSDSSGIHGTFAETQAETGNVEQAMRMAAGLRDRAVREWTLQRIAAIQAQAGDVPGAFRTVGALEAPRKTYALEEMAIAQATAGDTRGALQTALCIRDDAGRVSAVRYVSAAQGRSGSAKRFLAWATAGTSLLVKASALLGVAEGMLGLRDAEMARRKVRRRALQLGWRAAGRPRQVR